jgi:hypothetical protein
MRRAMVVLLLMFAAGCTSYHKVTDLNTGKAYYTTDIDRKSSGVVELKDGRTGTTITLPSSEVQEITKEEYKRGIYSEQG